MTQLPSIDGDLHNADWLRTKTWDLPTDPVKFQAYLDRTNQTLEEFLRLPVAQSMPPELRGLTAHLPGQHDQQDHGGGSGASPDDRKLVGEPVSSEMARAVVDRRWPKSKAEKAEFKPGAWKAPFKSRAGNYYANRGMMVYLDGELRGFVTENGKLKEAYSDDSRFYVTGESLTAHLPGQHDQASHAPKGSSQGQEEDTYYPARIAHAIEVIASNSKEFHGNSLDTEVRATDNPDEVDAYRQDLYQMIEELGLEEDLGVRFTDRALSGYVGPDFDSAVLVAGMDGVGLAGAAYITSRDEDGVETAYLDLIGTTGIAEGAGSVLIKEAAKWAAERDLPLVGDPIAEASEFYEKLGWEYDPLGMGWSVAGWTAEETKEIASS